VSTVELVQATKADAARIAELLNAIAQGLYGEPELTEAEAASWFVHEELEVLLAERDGALVGYGDRWREQERDRAWIDVRTVPGEAEAGAALVAELEQRARPDIDPGALAMTYVVSMDDTMRSVLEDAGYAQIRSSFRMTIPLADVVEPEWPDGLSVAPYDSAHEAAVHAAHQESFRDHWEHKDESLEEWRKWLVDGPRFDPTLWFVALDGDEVAGISLCQIHSSGDPEHGFVSVLAVRRPWRRRGLGLALLRHSFAEMKRRGMKRASLGVDAENLTGAVAIYERAGMTVERRSDCYSKAL
jgi:mycothiol synthase